MPKQQNGSKKNLKPKETAKKSPNRKRPATTIAQLSDQSGTVPAGYETMLQELKQLISEARSKALREVNKALIRLYWNMGERIVFEQEKQGWGKSVVEMLSRDLRFDFPDMPGLSAANLWRMRQFYLYYHQSTHPNEKLAAVLRELYKSDDLKELLYGLSWTHHTIVMGACTTELEREFYIRLAIGEKWSSRELRRQIDTDLFTRYTANLDYEPRKTLPAKPETIGMLPFRDEYILPFLGLKKKYSETELRKAILHNLRDFFLEFGRGLTFVAEEHVLTVGQGDFRVDLLFFHRDLQCLVAVELKVGPFKPEYVGKIQFYLSALDEQEKRKHEMPSIGLILCKSKDQEQVRLALTVAASKIGVATYKTSLPDEKKLKEYLRKLPIPED